MFGVVGSSMRGWIGSGRNTARYTNILPPAPEPPVFNPVNDISDCWLWLDANDSSTILTNENNYVLKWFDKAKPSNQNYYRHDGNPAGSGLYNTHYMNQLQTIYFPPNNYMEHEDGGVVYPFQARTFFAVIKPLTNLVDASGAVQPYIQIYNGTVAGAMNTGISYDSMSGNHQYSMCENGITCGVVFDLSNNPVNQRMILMYAQDTNSTNNVGAYDTASQSLTFSDPADAYDAITQIQYYLNDSTKGTAQDIAEIIMYGRCLTTTEQTRVLDYLADKWNLSGAGQDTLGATPSEPFYPTYGYAIYTQFAPDPPNFYWCDSLGNVESPPVLIVNYTGSTGDRDGTTYNILGTIYP